MKAFVIVICIIFISIPTASKANPLVTWLGGYLLGKIADGIWEKTTDLPDIRTLDTRLYNLEVNIGDEPIKKAISELRNQINERTTHSKYESYVRATLSSLQRQVDENTKVIRENTENISKNTEDINAILKRVDSLEKSQQRQTLDSKVHLKSASRARSFTLHHGKSMNIIVRGRPRSIWSNGFIEVWADQSTYHQLLRPEQYLNFPNSRVIHAKPRSSGEITLFLKPITR